jgi:antitoxin PrlF
MLCGRFSNLIDNQSTARAISLQKFVRYNYLTFLMSEPVMPSLTITTKGQVTFKKALLAHLGVEPGQQIEVSPLSGGRVEVRAAKPSSDLGAFVGCLSKVSHTTKKPVSIDDMNVAISEAWAGPRTTLKSKRTVARKAAR